MEDPAKEFDAVGDPNPVGMLDILVREPVTPQLPPVGKEGPLLGQTLHPRPKRVYMRKFGRQEDQTWSQYLAHMDNIRKRHVSFDLQYLTQTHRPPSQFAFSSHNHLPQRPLQQGRLNMGKSLSTGLIQELEDESDLSSSNDLETKGEYAVLLFGQEWISS